MEEEQRDKKAHKAYYDMLHFVANAQQGIPKLCPCGSITKEFVDEEDTYDYLPGKRYFICKDYQVKYKTMCQMKTKDGVSSLFSHGHG
ncbi:hypothetical protein Bca4012_056930 [Brassica carinata]